MIDIYSLETSSNQSSLKRGVFSDECLDVGGAVWNGGETGLGA